MKVREFVSKEIHRGFLAAKYRGPIAAFDLRDDPEDTTCGWRPTYEAAAFALRDGINTLTNKLGCRFYSDILMVAEVAAKEGVRRSFDITGKHSRFGWKVACLVAKCLSHGISERTAIRYAISKWR